MNWPTAKLIFFRELRDQLRDRRTLFTVAILPLLLYPLMGMAMLQVAQFMREYPTHVWIVGSEHLPSRQPFLDDGQIHERWTDPGKQDLQQLHLAPEEDSYFLDLIAQFKEHPGSEHPGNEDGGKLFDQLIQQEMQRREIDLAVIIPAPLEVAAGNRSGATAGESGETGGGDEVPGADEIAATRKPAVYVFVNSASDKSNIAAGRFNQSLSRWQKAMIEDKLAESNISMEVIDPFRVANADVAGASEKKAAAWSKVLPFIIMIWCLTGAFYPAVDLCAGEKERGTFETLLSSPASRSDIAIGKLLTVMTFSILTSILNLVSMAFTGLFVFSRISAMGIGGGGLAASMGPPPLAAIGWLLLALIPISALFSAMALAAAAFARSSKEGQYYLIPLMMISMPLMTLPMLPAAKLDIGTALIPVTGLMLMLRGLIEGQYAETLRFAGPVCAVTIACCWLAIRWVVIQFNSETVLFRASERFGVGAWLKHVLRERSALPSLGTAVICGILILVLKFFVGFALGAPDSWFMFTKQTLVVLVATVAVPAILMALVLTRNPRKSLRLHRCSIPVACAAVLAAICLHPFIMWIMTLVMHIYPPAGDLIMMQQMIGTIMNDAPNIWMILAVFALAPAVLEELAYRGFILSGAEAIKNKWTAVILTSLLFGLAHGIFQQSIITFFVGMILGWIAIRTGSLLPCILYHVTHNALTVAMSFITPSEIERGPWLGWIFEPSASGVYQYSVVPGIAMCLIGFGLLYWIVRIGGPRFLEQKKLQQEQPGFFDFGAMVDGWLHVKAKE